VNLAHASSRTLLVAAALVAAVPRAPLAQRSSSSVPQREVRAELAATLLAANRFDQAATEYRRLVAAEPQNHAYRLGLARALAWGEHPREAERELLLVRDRQNAAVVAPLLRSVRASIDPTAAEAERWMRESPGYAPYRLALARALAREDPRRAIAQFDTLRLLSLAGGSEGMLPSTTSLIHEEADAYLAFGERPAAITLLGAGLDQSPSDTALRSSLAAALFDAGSYDASRAEYDTLLAAAPTAAAYVGRANVGLARFDTADAQQDLVHSISVAPNYDAYYLLGSLARDRSDFVNARLLYNAARRLATNDAKRREVSAASAGLAREERPLVAFDADIADSQSWLMTSQASGDNAGVSLQSMRAQRGIELNGGFVSTIDIDAQRIAQRGGPGIPASTGTGAAVSLSREATAGRVTLGASARAGFLTHPGVATFGVGSVTGALWLDAWQLALDLSRAPAYESLFSGAALTAAGGEPTALTANATSLSAGGPLGPLDAAANWTRTQLSDGNVGTLLEGYGRAPLSGVSRHLSAVYEGTVQSFAAPSRLYWDPVHYASNAIGPEVSSRRAHGLSLSARVLAGLAHSVERDTTASAPTPIDGPRGKRRPEPLSAALIERSAVQVSTAADLTYRAAWWELAADIEYGRSRAGEYQRTAAAVTLRILR
jgi:tetratricopeptide (TPR) repeat protein